MLERLGLPVGVVSAIAGQSRIAVALRGVAGHAGTVPMEDRRDALCAAAELVLGVATAGVIPGAVVAAILNREFQSFLVSRRYQADTVRETPEVFGAVPAGTDGWRIPCA